MFNKIAENKMWDEVFRKSLDYGGEVIYNYLGTDMGAVKFVIDERLDAKIRFPLGIKKKVSPLLQRKVLQMPYLDFTSMLNLINDQPLMEHIYEKFNKNMRVIKQSDDEVAKEVAEVENDYLERTFLKQDVETDKLVQDFVGNDAYILSSEKSSIHSPIVTYNLAQNLAEAGIVRVHQVYLVVMKDKTVVGEVYTYDLHHEFIEKVAKDEE